jgi:hypothetical protein
MKPITWEPRKVKVADLKENPKNPKILNEKGKRRLHTSLGKFGLAGTPVVDKDPTIIDDHNCRQGMLLVPVRNSTRREPISMIPGAQ